MFFEKCFLVFDVSWDISYCYEVEESFVKENCSDMSIDVILWIVEFKLWGVYENG